MTALSNFQAECDDYDDAERFRWWFSSEAKQVDINGYITGVNMRWNLDEWRQFIDGQRRANKPT